MGLMESQVSQVLCDLVARVEAGATAEYYIVLTVDAQTGHYGSYGPFAPIEAASVAGRLRSDLDQSDLEDVQVRLVPCMLSLPGKD